MPEPLRATDREFVEEATRAFSIELARVVAEHERTGRRPRAVLGEPASFGLRAVRASAPVASPWDDLVGPFVRTDGVQSRLHISRQAVAAKAARRRLLRVVTVEGDHLYPLWQFADGRPLDGLPQVLSLFPEDALDGWTLAAWLRTTDPELGEAPLATLIGGAHERVRTVARAAARSLAS